MIRNEQPHGGDTGVVGRGGGDRAAPTGQCWPSGGCGLPGCFGRHNTGPRAGLLQRQALLSGRAGG